MGEAVTIPPPPTPSTRWILCAGCVALCGRHNVLLVRRKRAFPEIEMRVERVCECVLLTCAARGRFSRQKQNKKTYGDCKGGSESRVRGLLYLCTLDIRSTCGAHRAQPVANLLQRRRPKFCNTRVRRVFNVTACGHYGYQKRYLNSFLLSETSPRMLPGSRVNFPL